MDIGDLIFPLLIIGGIIVQWLTSQADEKKKRERRESQPPPELPDYEEEQQVNPFDDLMEALGQTGPAKDSEVPPPVPQTQSPPPLAQPSEPVRGFSDPTPSRIDPLEHQRKLLEQKRREVAQIKKTSRSHQAPTLRHSSSSHSRALPQRLGKIRRTLRDREDIRQAIVLNEILQKPVSMR